QPPTGRAIEVGDLLGHERRRIEREEQDGAADEDTLGDRRESRQSDDDLRTRVTRRDVTADPERVEFPCLELVRLLGVAGRDYSDPDLRIGPDQRRTSPSCSRSLADSARIVSKMVWLS